MPTRTEIEQLAAMGHALRPDWPTRSLVTHLARNHAERPYAHVAVALAWVATDPRTKTPARLAENGPWWAATRATSTPSTWQACPDHPGQPAGRCRECDRSGTPRPADFMAEFRALRRASSRTKTGTVVPPTEGSIK